MRVKLGPESLSSSSIDVLCGDPVKKLENQLLLGLEPIIGDELKGEEAPSVANLMTLDLLLMLIGEVAEGELVERSGLVGGDCENFLYLSLSRGGDVRLLRGDDIGECEERGGERGVNVGERGVGGIS